MLAYLEVLVVIQDVGLHHPVLDQQLIEWKIDICDLCIVYGMAYKVEEIKSVTLYDKYKMST